MNKNTKPSKALVKTDVSSSYIRIEINAQYKMQRQSIIVFIQGEKIETYGNLKKCCEMENLKYHTLARLKFPIRINDVVIHKTLFK